MCKIALGSKLSKRVASKVKANCTSTQITAATLRNFIHCCYRYTCYNSIRVQSAWCNVQMRFLTMGAQAPAQKLAVFADKLKIHPST